MTFDVEGLEQRLRGEVLLHRVGERAHRRALTQDLERDALPEVALSPSVLEQGLIRPAEHVHEAGRDGQVTRIELIAPLPTAE